MTRAISTAVDAVLFLLLVSASVVTLAAAPTAPAGPSAAAPDADAPATTLRAATIAVDYSLAPGVRRADPATPVDFESAGGPGFERTAHGSLAGLVGDAAVRNLSVGAEQVTHAGDGFEEAVAAAAANATGPRTHVSANWRPYPGAPVGGHLEAGRAPPPSVTVASERLTVDSGGPAVRDDARRAANRSGYDGVARVVANAVVGTALPPSKMRLALRGDYPVDALAAHRYWRFGSLLGVDARPDPETVVATNGRLSRTLAERLGRDLRARFDSPAAAARAVRVAEVEIVVRRWSRERPDGSEREDGRRAERVVGWSR